MIHLPFDLLIGFLMTWLRFLVLFIFLTNWNTWFVWGYSWILVDRRVIFQWLRVNDSYGLRRFFWQTFQKFIRIYFALFDFIKFLHHISFLLLYLLFHKLSLLYQLLSLSFDLISFEHFFLDSIHQLLFFILLNFHDSLNILSFIS